MVPTYNSSDLLEKTLRSVLDQDPGREQMQIAVVDDCSPNGHAEAVVNRMAPDRVEFLKNPSRGGLAANWNSSIRQSRGHWIHILHQDDLVLPGFYQRMRAAAELRPDLGAAFCQHLVIDEDGNWTRLSPLERSTPGVLEGWIEQIAVSQRIQCPSIVVARSAYEQLGGFRAELVYCLDWEMWVRISAQYAVWFEPTALACYRSHGANETTRLGSAGADAADWRRTIDVIQQYLPKPLRPSLRREAVRCLGRYLLDRATTLMNAGERKAGTARMRQAFRYDKSLVLNSAGIAHLRWAAKLWLQEVLT
jgi:glycosyltransferase involved in cell wall biosynthesis